MMDSTARAPRFEADSSPAPSYLWAPPQKPVAVSIPLAVIDQLERESVETFRSLSSRGSEIGGLLFGTVTPGSPLVVVIDSYEAVTCDYSSGPLYRLAEAERARLDRTIEQRLGVGVKAVGFYRSHTRKGLSLDADDLALFETRFTEPHQFALLIRPAATKVSMAGIFIRENGTMKADASCLEFPFRSSQHDNHSNDALYDGAVAGPRSFTASPVTPRPVIRAQIVPIASRREITPEPTLPPVIQSAPEAEEPVVAAAPPAVPAPAATTTVAPPATPKPEPKVEPKIEPKPATKIAPEPLPPVAAAPVADFEPEPMLSLDEPAKRSGKMLWIALGTLVPVVLLIGFFFSSAILRRHTSVPGAAQDASPLSLRVDRNGADIVLTWNRDSDVIKGAKHAVLSISDGTQHENVEMDLPQLKNGSIVYSPVTSDVVFKMEVSGTDQTKTTSESVRVLRTRPSPMPDGTEQAATPSPVPAPKGPTAAVPPTEAPAPPPVVEEEKVALAQAMKPFKAESLAQRLHTASADMPDAPVVGAPAASSNVNLGNLMSTQAAPPPSAPVASEKKSVGGQIQQAVLLKRRDPEYPKLARDSGASGVVEVMALIGADGHVKSVQVVKGHPLLRQAAIDAVKAWVYKPTILNGVAVEAQTQVILNFKGDR